MRYVIASAIVMLLSSTPILRADETVSIGGSNAVLLRPSAPRASVILMPGGDGYIAAGPGGTIGKLNGNQLVRTRNAYLARGLAVFQPANLKAPQDIARDRKSTRLNSSHSELSRMPSSA